ncbi:MAG: hypothetical protein ACTS6A_02880 [Candidatus Hodgkinia cicadicola]
MLANRSLFNEIVCFAGWRPWKIYRGANWLKRDFRFEMANESEQTCDSAFAKASTNKTERSFQLLFDNAMTARKMIWLSRLKERTSVTEEPFGFEVKSMEVRGKKWYYELMVRFVSNGC